MSEYISSQSATVTAKMTSDTLTLIHDEELT